MAKIPCICGALLFDSSDFLPNKGYIVADQDLEDVADASAASVSTFPSYSKRVFQCDDCCRLIIDLPDGLHFFSADDPKKSQKILRSVHGNDWKRNLRATWFNGVGQIWWGFGVDDEAFEPNIASWEELSDRYFETFERLRIAGLLRSSFLRRDGDLEHKWP